MNPQRPPDLNEIRRLQEKYPELDLSWMLVDYIEYLELQTKPLDLYDRLFVYIAIGVPVGLFMLIIVCTMFSIG